LPNTTVFERCKLPCDVIDVRRRSKRKGSLLSKEQAEVDWSQRASFSEGRRNKRAGAILYGR
jgi:hypothetical protein